jgi:hypothetical protein
MNYNRNLDDAPREYQIVGVLPTGNHESPLRLTIMWWNEEENRWDGSWRDYVDEQGKPLEGFLAGVDPIAWAEASRS